MEHAEDAPADAETDKQAEQRETTRLVLCPH
jgi:hypothetical protein